MSFADGKYNGELYIGHVKWSNDYRHVMAFTDGNGNFSEASRTSFLKSTLTKKPNNISAVSDLNGYIDVDGKLSGLESANYIMFKNDSDFSDTYFCCFITDFKIVAEKSTRLFIQLDVFQQYFYSTTFFNSVIKRAHISKAEDNANWWKYTTSEPVGFKAVIERSIHDFALDFSPVLMLDTVSDPTNNHDASWTEYKIGGMGNAFNMTGLYRWHCPDSADFNEFCKAFQYPDQLDGTNNHYSDIVGFKFIPAWVYTRATFDGTARLLRLATNALITATEPAFGISYDSLACGYTPVNKKMYTSLANGFKLWNKNGLSVPIMPELLGNRNSVTISLHQRPMSETFKIEIENYKDLAVRFIDLQYSFSVALGLNFNTGVATENRLQALNMQGAVLKESQNQRYFNLIRNVVSGTAGSVGAIYGGNIAGGLTEVAGSTLGMAMGLNMEAVKQPLENIQQQQAVADAGRSIITSVGSNSDRTAMTNDFLMLRFACCSPTTEECAILDDFLTMYGYAIDEIGSVPTFMRTRPEFNFVQTDGINLTAPCPAVYEQQLKRIFDSGVTIWKNYSHFGNYAIQNW